MQHCPAPLFLDLTLTMSNSGKIPEPEESATPMIPAEERAAAEPEASIATHVLDVDNVRRFRRRVCAL
jgi:hypothetical protein